MSFFTPDPFISHGHCYLWKQELLWLHIVSDSLIALAYYSISIALIYFVQKRRDLPYISIFLLFGAFIVSCGTTHLMEVWTLWHPTYWLSGFLKAFTASISVYAAAVLMPIIPQALALPNQTQLEDVNCELEAEIIERNRIEEKLRSSQQMLQLVMDNIPQFICWKDRNSVYLGCNRNFARMAGIASLEEIVGKTDYDLPWKKEESDFFRECDTRVMGTNTPEYNIIEPILQADSKQAWLNTNKIPLHDRKENVVGILVTIEDITVRQQAEEILKQTNEELEIRVEERTAQLREAIDRLQSEIACREQTETAMKASEIRYRNLVETSQDLIWSMDDRGRYTFVNSAAERILGYKPEETIGHLFTDFLTPQLQSDCGVYDRALAGESCFHYELVHLRKDGTPVQLSFNAIALRDDDCNFLGTTGTARDVSDRKQAEEALHKSTQLLRTVINNLPAILYCLDSNGVFTMSEGKALEALGLKPGEVVGQSVFDLYSNYPSTLEHLRCVLAGTPTTWFSQLDNLIYDNRATPLLDENGDIVGSIGVAIDITDRQQALEALQRSEARFREAAQREALLNRLASQIRSSLELNTILETVVQEIRNLLQIDRCVFVWYRTEDEAPYWEIVQEAKNSALPSLIGFQASSAEIWPIAEKSLNKEIIWIDDVETVPDLVTQQFFSSLGYTAALSLPIHTQSGEIGVVSCANSTCSRSWSHSEVELLQAVVDQIAIAIDQAALYKQSRIAAAVAEAKTQQLEFTLRELQQAQAQLIQSEKMSSLGQLVAGVAHEINNPVNFIHGNVTYADRYALDLLNLVQLYQKYYPAPVREIQEEMEAIDLHFIKEDLPKILSSMKMGTDRIRQIVLSLRNFSRLDEADMKQVDIHSGIDSTLLILQNRIKAKQDRPAIQVIKEYGNLPLVECYAGQLNQVFMNILTNAIDALDECNKKRSQEDIKNNPSTIWICTKVLDSKSVMIRIADNGPGMTQEVQRRLFDPFFTTKAVGAGTGLGMSVSYQIVTQHDGQLTCISSPGEGAEFLIQVPIRQQKGCPSGIR